jgi:hypothetical protein
MGAALVASRIHLAGVTEKRSERQEVTSMLKAEHVAGPLRCTVGTVQIPVSSRRG